MNAFSMISAGRFALALAAAALLAGCASTGTSLASKSTLNTARDSDYMQAVERAARVRGVHVVWVNPPPEKGRNYLARVK